MSICKIAAGSGAGFGHRAVGSGSLFGAIEQPDVASSISASNGIAHRLRSRESIGVLLCCSGVAEFLEAYLRLVLECGISALRGVLSYLGFELLVRKLLGVQAHGLRSQQDGEDECSGDGAVGFELVEDHSHALHHSHHMAIKIGFISIHATSLKFAAMRRAQPFPKAGQVGRLVMKSSRAPDSRARTACAGS